MGMILYRHSRKVQALTPLQTEALACLHALKYLLTIPDNSVDIKTDSLLLLQ